jgi:hypothetical protein
MKIVEIRKHLLVREDGMVKNINPSKQSNANKDWHYGSTNGRGYKLVRIPGTGKLELIHRLVGEAFIDNSDKKPMINHIDECKSNNHVSNLEWVTNQENLNYGSCQERKSKAMTNGKLSKPILQLTKDGELVKEWISATEAGRNGFIQGNISYCCQGKRNTHAGYLWKYK